MTEMAMEVNDLLAKGSIQPRVELELGLAELVKAHKMIVPSENFANNAKVNGKIVIDLEK